jgi:hypothetical protein
MYLQKVICRKNCVKNQFFAGILKVNDENPNPIRIHPKMSLIRNTGRSKQKLHIYLNYFPLKKKSRNEKRKDLHKYKNIGTGNLLEASKKYQIHLMTQVPLTWFTKIKLNAHLWK